jgi:hypothetical protein
VHLAGCGHAPGRAAAQLRADAVAAAHAPVAEAVHGVQQHRAQLPARDALRSTSMPI